LQVLRSVTEHDRDAENDDDDDDDVNHGVIVFKKTYCLAKNGIPEFMSVKKIAMLCPF